MKSKEFMPKEVSLERLPRVSRGRDRCAPKVEMRTSCRTYPLFDLAKVILGKPERFVVLATPVKKSGGEPSDYFVTKLDGLPFTAREEAYRHLMDHHGESFYEVEEREVARAVVGRRRGGECPSRGQVRTKRGRR